MTTSRSMSKTKPEVTPVSATPAMTKEQEVRFRERATTVKDRVAEMMRAMFSTIRRAARVRRGACRRRWTPCSRSATPRSMSSTRLFRTAAGRTARGKATRREVDNANQSLRPPHERSPDGGLPVGAAAARADGHPGGLCGGEHDRPVGCCEGVTGGHFGTGEPATLHARRRARVTAVGGHEASQAQAPAAQADAASGVPERGAGEGTSSSSRCGRRKVLIVMPTGGGKTCTAAEACRQHVNAEGGRVLWVAHRRELIKQGRDTLERYGLRVGAFGLNSAAPVQVESIQSLVHPKRREVPPATLVVADEAHHLLAEEWRKLAEMYKECLLIGLTATPERGDGQPLGDIFDALVVAAQMSQLIAMHEQDPTVGLVPCDVKRPVHDDGIAVGASQRRGRAASGRGLPGVRRTASARSSSPRTSPPPGSSPTPSMRLGLPRTSCTRRCRRTSATPSSSSSSEASCGSSATSTSFRRAGTIRVLGLHPRARLRARGPLHPDGGSSDAPLSRQDAGDPHRSPWRQLHPRPARCRPEVPARRRGDRGRRGRGGEALPDVRADHRGAQVSERGVQQDRRGSGAEDATLGGCAARACGLGREDGRGSRSVRARCGSRSGSGRRARRGRRPRTPSSRTSGPTASTRAGRSARMPCCWRAWTRRRCRPRRRPIRSRRFSPEVGSRPSREGLA